jgi:membrane protease YdiL (CAAX protease family)
MGRAFPNLVALGISVVTKGGHPMRTKDDAVTPGHLRRVETRGDRRALARDAGLRQISGISIVAGTLSAYGAVAVLLAIAGGIAAAVNSGTDFSNVSWTQLKTGTGILVAVILLLSYLFGGYVAGRMARRSGVANGIGVFVLGIVVALVVGIWVKQAGGGSNLTDALRNIGAPTTWHEWSDVGTVAGIAALAAMLVGSILGGSLGDRWHSKLVARALDPTIGPEAELAREAQAAHFEAEQRVATAAPETQPGVLEEERLAADRRLRSRTDTRTQPVSTDAAASDTTRSGRSLKDRLLHR